MTNLHRREFLGIVAVVPAAIATGQPKDEGHLLAPATFLGSLKKEAGEGLIPGSSWYVAAAENDGIDFRFPAGTLANVKYITTDMLLDGDTLAVFFIHLKEGEGGREFHYRFGALTQCSLRVRMDLSMVDQSRWLADREGAFLKPTADGDRVDLSKADRMTLTLARKAPGPARWCMTAIVASPGPVEKITVPLLPKGKLIDKFGQSAQRRWPGKTTSEDQLKSRIREQYAGSSRQAWPDGFSKWGGYKGRRLAQASGFFRTHHDGQRWWLVDPEGYAFWSAGLDCVRVDGDARIDGLESALEWLPDPKSEFADAYYRERVTAPGKSVNYLATNMIRALGPEGWRDKWAQIALAEMKRLRFNTVGNWSEYKFAAKAGFPYVRPMSFRAQRSGMVYRDFPDVYHAGFEQDAADYASQLANTANDPAFIGYFLMNEPTWGFSTELPATGMLYNTGSCATRDELVRFLKAKYEGEAALASSWKSNVTFDRIGKAKWQGVLAPEALADLREFSSQMVERYFQVLSSACRKADPHHLNLGMRWAGIPPDWAAKGMRFFDVYSLNCYQQKLPLERARAIHEMLKMPVLVGEWHFGALDVGLPGSGIGHLKNQQERAKAYRVYLEDAAADPYCVGVHWFTLYDQSALGRSDGENYNIGFLDICNRPYTEMGAAAIESHERMYDVAAGKAAPYAAQLEYLPMVFL